MEESLGEFPSRDVENFASWRRDSSLGFHVVGRFPVWVIGYGSRKLEDSIMFSYRVSNLVE